MNRIKESKKRVHPVRIRGDLIDELQHIVRDYSGKPFHLTQSLVMEEAVAEWLKRFKERIIEHERALHKELSGRYGATNPEHITPPNKT